MILAGLMPALFGFAQSNVEEIDFIQSIYGMEKKAIVEALEKTRWSQTAAAKQLCITFRALRYRLKQFGIDLPPL